MSSTFVGKPNPIPNMTTRATAKRIIFFHVLSSTHTYILKEKMIKKREENEQTLRNSYKKYPIIFLGD